MANYQLFAGMTEAHSISQIMKEMDTLLQKLNHHQGAIDLWDQTGQSVYEAVHRQMDLITRECMQNYYVLAKIESALETSREKKMFDIINIIGIKACSEKLLESINSCRQQSLIIQDSIYTVTEGIEEERKNNKDSFAQRVVVKIADTVGMTVLGHVAGATAMAVSNISTRCYPNRTVYSGKGVFLGLTTAGLLVGAAIVSMRNCCKTTNINSISEVLVMFQEKIFALQLCCDDFVLLTTEIIEDISNYTDSVDENAAYPSQSGERTVILASKMIEETTKLQSLLIK